MAHDSDLSEALVVEAVHLRDLAGLVVASQQAHARRETDLFEQETTKRKKGRG